MGKYDQIIFIDTEVSASTGKVMDYGAVSRNGLRFHSASQREFGELLRPFRYICGHNIRKHDLKYISGEVEQSQITGVIDTLYLSPLLFPNKPYHALLKDDKLQVDELNNPQNDAQKCMELFFDEMNAFYDLKDSFRSVLEVLLGEREEFSAFFSLIKERNGVIRKTDISMRIQDILQGKICENADVDLYVKNYPVELSYCLSLIYHNDGQSIIPHWVHVNFPMIETIMGKLRSTPCKEGCPYCRKELDVKVRLRKIFGYEDFRKYNGESLQEDAVRAAMRGESLIAIFPTGGGKSLTFQLPALISGELSRTLTVVISPLQSLMKDQVDNLEKRGIADAVTINGMLSPIERAEALSRVEGGIATLLYISPEQLRSRTIERILMARNIGRFVIDEAHCFSSWGQDFRVEYLYIGEFIRQLQEKKGGKKIPVSCFTATAKQKVIRDIKDYFKEELGIELSLFATNASRSNLRYEVIFRETEEEKYITLRNLIEVRRCPTIVYVSRTKKTVQLAERLRADGFTAKAFNGRMDRNEKAQNQEAFIKDEVQVMIATSAFGMGVDKSNVKLVIHYDISDSLENYVQEAGRAGRDPKINAECFILFNDNDLDKHFLLLNQTKLSISEIQQVWKAIKDLTRTSPVLRRSPLEIARQAGWDENVQDVETRVKTAVQALERAGYIKRGKNVPRVYATSIRVHNFEEAGKQIEESKVLQGKMKEHAKRIMQLLISKRSIAKAGNEEAESRTDYISDILGISREDTLHTITALREIGILEDFRDLTAYLNEKDRENKTLTSLRSYIALEKFLLEELNDNRSGVNLKELNDKAQKMGLRASSVNKMKRIFYYWTIRGYIQKQLSADESHYQFSENLSHERMLRVIETRQKAAERIAEYLYRANESQKEGTPGQKLVSFSEMELKNYLQKELKMEVSFEQIEDAILYLSKMGVMQLEDGFLVLYSSIELKRLELDNRIKYKAEDYKQLNEYYMQKVQQIHIVGEFANMMVKDYEQALEFVNNYFQMDYKLFIKKYFAGERQKDIEQNITPQKYKKLFGCLSEMQLKIIQDDTSKYIVVAAGPGSGKTRVLVHKLASLLLLEDVKHEQLLMLTFSRAAAIEFKQRLYELIGNAAAFVEIKTFHSYCFDLLGKVGRIEDSSRVVSEATKMIREGEVELGKIVKSVLVIDEAQDMDAEEYELVCALMECNEEMRVIAVGDDDQNIYQFRGADAKYMEQFVSRWGAVTYELVDNYRSARRIVAYANRYAKGISKRLKQSPIKAVSDREGEVKLFSHRSKNIEIPLVQDLCETYKAGTVCVLTNTNAEALQILGLLIHRGLDAKLIQSNDGFALEDLVEVRFLIQRLEEKRNPENPVICEDAWKEVRKEIEARFSDSTCLEIIRNLMDAFEKSSSHKFYSDLRMFIQESSIEDFYSTEKGTVYVSTFHKAKGREYDSVYMMLKNESGDTDEKRRKIYVGMTRAKEQLHIHYNREIFAQEKTEDFEYIWDEHVYGECEQLISQLSHKDVVLSFFKGKAKDIIRLRSGMELEVRQDGVYMASKEYNGKVAQFSRKYREDIQKYRLMGYVPVSARIRFLVRWKEKEDLQYSVLVLPDVVYERCDRKEKKHDFHGFE